MAETTGDTGLGLSEFLSRGSEEAEEITEASLQTPEETPIVEPTATKTEGEAAPEVKTEQTEEQKVDWEKRYKDTHRNWNEEHQARLRAEQAAQQVSQQTQERQLQFMAALLDSLKSQGIDISPEELVNNVSRYTAPQQQVQQQIQQVAQAGEISGAIRASRTAAIEKFGEQEVFNALWAPEAPFKQVEGNPIVQHRVLNSPSPVLEAMKVVKEKEFCDKYGYEPETVKRNIITEYAKEVEARVTDKILKKFNLKQSLPTGIGEARGAGDQGIVSADNVTPLKTIFGR